MPPETTNTEKTIPEKINITDIDANEVQKINSEFSDKPRETIKNLKQIIDGIDKEEKEELAAKIVEGINTCNADGGNDFDTIENIAHFLTLLENIKTLDPKIDQITEGVDNPYNTIKQTLETKKTTLEQEKSQNKLQEVWLKSFQDILNEPNNTPDLLLQNGKKLFEKNSVAYNTLFDETQRNNLTETQKDNLKKIILTYALWWKDIYEKIWDKNTYIIPKSLNEWRFKTNEPKYLDWTKIIQIPQKDIIGDIWGTKVYEIYFWTTDQLHQARTDKTILTKSEKNDETKWFNMLDVKTREIIKIENTSPAQYELWKTLPIDKIIANLDEAWSYTAFKVFLDKADPRYLQQNFATILSQIQTIHNIQEDNKTDKYEWKNEKINGYYKVIAEKVVDLAKKWDKNTLQTYLKFVEQNPSYLWLDGQNRIDTRNIVAKRWDANILHSQWNDQLKALYIKIKMQIDPNGTKKEILEQVDDVMNKFFEQYGDIIAQVVDLFGGKETFMKYLPDNLKEKFKKKFKEKFQMSELQAKNFDEINKSFDNTIDKTPQKDATTAIEWLQKDNTEKGKIKTSLIQEENFSKLSPNLVANVIKEYNKKPKDNVKIEASDFIVVDAKGKPEKVKPWTDTWRDVIINKLLDTWSTLRNTIKTAHNEIATNATKEFEKSDKSVYTMDINGSSVDKGIKSYRDVATYISAYVTTWWQPPFRQVIAENDIVETQTSHKSSKKIEQPEKTPEQKHGETITTINKIIESGKYKNWSADVDFPTNYDGKNNPEYEKSIIIPINDIFKADKLAGENTYFAETAKNIDKLAALKEKPQVLKDLLTYKAKDKPELIDIAKLFMNEANPATLETKVKIEKNTDGNILVQISDKKKFTIKPGPTFEIPTA